MYLLFYSQTVKKHGHSLLKYPYFTTFHLKLSEIQVQWQITLNFKHHHLNWCLRTWCCFSHWKHLGLHSIRVGTRRFGISLQSNCSMDKSLWDEDTSRFILKQQCLQAIWKHIHENPCPNKLQTLSTTHDDIWLIQPWHTMTSGPRLISHWSPFNVGSGDTTEIHQSTSFWQLAWLAWGVQVSR